jgi:hypothetical protein
MNNLIGLKFSGRKRLVTIERDRGYEQAGKHVVGMTLTLE